MRAVLTEKAISDEESAAEVRCTAYSADGGAVWSVWLESPTKIRVYGSKRMTDRNVGVQDARRRGGVKVVSMKLPVLLQAARILRISRIMLAGLKD